MGMPALLWRAPPWEWWLRHSLDPEWVGRPALPSAHFGVSFLPPATIPSGREVSASVYTALEKPWKMEAPQNNSPGGIGRCLL